MVNKSVLYETPVVVGLSVLVFVLILMMVTKPSFLQHEQTGTEDGGQCKGKCCSACALSLPKLLSFSVVVGILAGGGTYWWEKEKKK